jgi:hypothetical protein
MFASAVTEIAMVRSIKIVVKRRRFGPQYKEAGVEE